MATIDEVLSILLASQTIDELPTATSFTSSDWFIFFNATTQRTEKISGANLQSLGGWIWIEGSWVEKPVSNTSKTTLEANDIVYFKKITNNGDPVTLVGYTYVSGDKELEASYEQYQAITT